MWRVPMATNCARCRPLVATMCRWMTPTWPICVTKKCARPRGHAETTRMNCRTATPSSSTWWWRKSPPACCWRCICAGATSRARTPRRATTSQWPKRCSRKWTSTPISWSTTTTAAATSSRCASCPKERPSCSVWSRPSSAPWSPRTISSAESTRRRATRRWSSSRCRRSAAFPARCTATTSRSRRSGPSCAW